MPEAFEAVRAAHREETVERWFRDEARFGQQGTLARVRAERGTRPRALRQAECEWVCLFGAVCPTTGEAQGGLLPWVNREAMEKYLLDSSRNLRRGVHAWLVMDGADWHMTGVLSHPDHVTIRILPPKSPERNPSEWLWREMRQKYMGNRAFPTVESLDEAVSAAWLEVIASSTAV